MDALVLLRTEQGGRERETPGPSGWAGPLLLFWLSQMWRRADRPLDATSKADTAMATAAPIEWVPHHQHESTVSSSSSRVDAPPSTANSNGDLVVEPVTTTADPHIQNWDPEVEKLLDVDDTRAVGVIKDTSTLQQQQQQHQMRLAPASPAGLLPVYPFDSTNAAPNCLRPTIRAPTPMPTFWNSRSETIAALDTGFGATCLPGDTMATMCVEL